ncbi:MAG TPA: hypothetical protein VNO23_12665, partial [Candidatus Binatia bacterium]|nr:hypothetical protein [Candidatus Binatia bacterium]
MSGAAPIGGTLADALGPGSGWLIAAAADLLAAGEPGSPWRHLWVIPVALAALRFGLAGGAVAAVAAVMVQAPAMLVHLERLGPAAPVVEELVTAAHLLALGPLLGTLTTEARRQRRRVRTLLDLQAVLADETAADAALERVRACLAARLDAEVALVLREGDRWLTAGEVVLDPQGPAAAAVRAGRSVFVTDTGDRPRPCRVLAAPLSVGGQPAGALIVTREGELPAGERRAI